MIYINIEYITIFIFFLIKTFFYLFNTTFFNILKQKITIH